MSLFTRHHFSLVHHYDIVAALQEINQMSRQDDRLVQQKQLESACEDLLGHLAVHCRQRIVEQVNVGLRVECPRQPDPGLLAARERDALLAHQRVLAVLEQLEVAQQTARLDHFGVALRVEGSPEKDVLADGPGEDHQILLAVAHLALDLSFTAVEGQFVEENLEEGSLAAADWTAEPIKLALLDGEIDVF